MAPLLLSAVNHFHTVNSRCHRSLWFLVLLFIGLLGKLVASDPWPPTEYYRVLNPVPGQLDPNHWKRLQWSGTVSNVASLPNGRVVIAGNVVRNGYHGFTNLAVLDRFGWAETNAPRFIAEPPAALASLDDGSIAIVPAGGREIRFLGPDFEPDLRWKWPPEQRRHLQHTITCLTTDGEGSWLVGGIQGDGTNSPTAPFVDRVRPDGEIEAGLDSAFLTLPGDAMSVDVIRPTAGERLLVSFRSRPKNSTNIVSSFVRMLRGGLPDRSFVPAKFLEFVELRDVAVAPDGRIYLAHDRWVYPPNTRVRHGVTRINADGSFDPTFGDQFSAQTPPGSTRINALLVDAHGRLMVGGAFSFYDRVYRQGLVRLFDDGSVDPSFVAGDTFSGMVTALHWDQQRRLVVAGNFAASDRFERNDVDPPFPSLFGQVLNLPDLAILHNTDRPLAASPRLTNGVFAVESFLPATGYLILERSADMVHWQGFRTNFAAGTNWLRVSFPVGEADGGEFYRVSVRP